METMLGSFKDHRNKLVHNMANKHTQDNFQKSLNIIWRVLKELDRSKRTISRVPEVGTATHPKEKSEEKKSAERQESETTIRNGIIRRIINDKEEYADDELNFTITLSIDENKTEFVKTAISKFQEELQEALEFFRDYSKAEQLISPIHINNIHFAGLYITKTPNKHEDEEKEKNPRPLYTVIYFDPLGNTDIPNHVSNAISDALGVKKENIIINKNVIQSKKNFTATNKHCGAFVSFILSNLQNGTMQVKDSRILVNTANINEDANWIDLPDLTEKSSNHFGKNIRDYHFKLLTGQLDQNENFTTFSNIIREIFNPNSEVDQEVQDQIQYLQQTKKMLYGSKTNLDHVISNIVKNIVFLHKQLKSQLGEKDQQALFKIISITSIDVDLLKERIKDPSNVIHKEYAKFFRIACGLCKEKYDKKDKQKGKQLDLLVNGQKIKKDLEGKEDDLEKRKILSELLESRDAIDNQKISILENELQELFAVISAIEEIKEDLKKLPDLKAYINQDELLIEETEKDLKTKKIKIPDFDDSKKVNSSVISPADLQEQKQNYSPAVFHTQFQNNLTQEQNPQTNNNIPEAIDSRLSSLVESKEIQKDKDSVQEFENPVNQSSTNLSTQSPTELDWREQFDVLSSSPNPATSTESTTTSTDSELDWLKDLFLSPNSAATIELPDPVDVLSSSPNPAISTESTTTSADSELDRLKDLFSSSNSAATIESPDPVDQSDSNVPVAEQKSTKRETANEQIPSVSPAIAGGKSNQRNKKLNKNKGGKSK